MKKGDVVFVHGYVDEIKDGYIVIKNKGGVFTTCKDETFPNADFPWMQLSYPTDKFSVLVNDGEIHLINNEEIGVVVDMEWKRGKR